jgi:2-desacetyl-2-hydroxyethyl bacteriochlorophyllide A dehydrogenase
MSSMTAARVLVFTGDSRVRIEERPLPPPGPGEVRVATEISAVSPGSERVVYRGDAPSAANGGGADADTVDPLSQGLTYPTPYGYSAVGRVDELGEGVDDLWRGRRVFAFEPHGSAFVAAVDDLLAVPDGMDPETAALYPNMETAVTLVLDGAPALGERVVVFGQGVVGLLATALLARFPLTELATVEPAAARRELSLRWGAHRSLAPDELDPGCLADGARADLTYELSGVPEALDAALESTGFAGRVVVGSWYGRRRVSLDLGGRFHRSRIRLVASQVSTLDPARTGRWDRERRGELAWRLLGELPTSELVSHRLPLDQAEDAYRRLEQGDGDLLQVVFDHRPDQI